MTDTGKHSALRQTSDGSFEIVFERDGLQEVSEEYTTLAEVTGPEPRKPSVRPSNRVIALTIGGVAALLLVAGVGWFAVGSRDAPTPELQEAPGFKPYGGGAEPAAERPQPTTRDRAAIAAALAADDEEHGVEVAEEITESEPGWELSEAVEPAAPTMPIEEVVVEEVVEEPEVADVEPVPVDDTEGPPDEVNRVRMFSGRQGLDGLRASDIGRSMQAPRVPNLEANALTNKRLGRLPLRGLQNTDTAIEAEAVAEEDELVEEEIVVEEEFVEE